MILQELIRNFILYREVVKPMVFSWKDSFTTKYQREIAGNQSFELISALQTIKARGGGEELGWDISDDYERMAVAKTAGTHTITDKHRVLYNKSEAGVFWETASISKKMSILLRDNRMSEKAAKIGKMIQATFVSTGHVVILATKELTSTTTGFESKQIKSLLITEIHEKREYLGEFSLPHEETPLMTYLEGRWVS